MGRGHIINDITNDYIFKTALNFQIKKKVYIGQFFSRYSSLYMYLSSIEVTGFFASVVLFFVKSVKNFVMLSFIINETSAGN